MTEPCTNLPACDELRDTVDGLRMQLADVQKQRDEAYGRLRIATQALREIESWDTPSLMARVALGRMGMAKP